MSELVEKVARAICRKSWNEDYLQADMRLEDIVDGSWGEYVEEARAAVAAVAEWLDDALKDDDGRIYVPQFLRAELTRSAGE